MTLEASHHKQTSLVALVSDGTKLPVLWQHTQDNPTARLGLVISNKNNSPGSAFAQERGIPFVPVPWYKNREPRANYCDRLAQTIIDRLAGETRGIASHDYLIVSAGQPYVLTDEFLDRFEPKRMINLHPALLPDNPDYKEIVLSNGERIPALRRLYGYDLFTEILRLGLRWTGVTVHYMEEKVDAGDVILRSEIPVLAGDTVTQLAKRVHQREDEILPQAIDIAIRCLGPKETSRDD